MDLAFSQQQEMLRTSVREFLGRECDRLTVRELEASELGYSKDLWRKVADLGWLGIIFPQAHGGLGGSFQDLVIVLEEFGRGPFPSPYQTTIVQSGLTLLELGSETQRQLLSQIIAGEVLCSFALTEQTASYEPGAVELRATPEGDGFKLTGSKLFIQYAGGADYLLVVARTRETSDPEEGLSIFLVESGAAGVGMTPLNSIGGDKQCEVTFDGAVTPVHSLVGPLHGAWPALSKVLALSTITLSAEMAGGAQAALELAVEYSKARVQFGRPIASFQAIQHYAADMLIEADAARFAVYEAAWRVDSGLSYELEASEAKAICSEAYQNVTARGHQILGGIGFYQEMDMQLWYRRAKAMEQLMGDADYHREKVAQLMGL